MLVRLTVAALIGGLVTAHGAAARQAPAAAVERPAVAFDEALGAAKELPRLHSLLASRRGELILERYFNGARATRDANVKSVAKSVISALVGVAIDRGLIPATETPIRTYFPELAKDRDDRKQRITIEDLLTMRSGLESTSNRNYGAWVQSRNWVQHALAKPVFTLPGTEMEYSTGNTHLLSAILTKATGTSTWQFAQNALARPLGFTLPRWPQDPQGIYFGGNDMLLTPRQMLAFGELYLNGGRARGGQVVPSRWIETSFVPRGYSRISGQRYGYGWWMRELAGHQAYFAWGFGGQYIVIVPALELVVVTTSASTVAEDRRSHRRTLFELVEDLVIAPVAAAQGAATPRS
ncbi:MAG TPA: serine hydrolase [Vicinamibacterales bacterium]|nr:serine hydrolase [Vicinamibacterales bacterium]